jgi:hypothetical protein
LLAIPAAGVGVERLFNSSRDICHYRRGRLHPDTIRLLMMKLCMTRFELAEDLRVIKAELPAESDCESDSDSDDCDTDFLYISDDELDDPDEDIDSSDGDTDDNDNNSNRSRQASSIEADYLQGTIHYFINTEANKDIR